MGKFDGILICTDLDGTLYRNDKTISPENKAAIEYFKSEGGYFTFITGRMPYYSVEAYNSVNPNVPFGCVNGGGVYDGAAQRYVWTQELSAEFVDLVECIDEKFSDVGIQLRSFDKTYFAKENQTMVDFRKLTGVPNLTCDYHLVTEPLGKIIFGSGEEETISSIEKTLREHPMSQNFYLVRSEKTLFEVLPRGVNKGLALAKLVEYLQIDPNKTVAIGDYNNDIGMFEFAGIGVAVSNASQEALDAADHITVSNEDGAIARVISDLESGKLSLA